MTLDCVSGSLVSISGVPVKLGLAFFCSSADDCASLRSSSVFQQGEAVFLEARVEAPLHPPLTLFVDYCVATLKPDPLSSPSYKFLTKHGSVFLSNKQTNKQKNNYSMF